MVVSSREKINNNKNLVRVITKSKSKTQSLMDVSVEGYKIRVSRSVPTSETSSSE